MPHPYMQLQYQFDEGVTFDNDGSSTLIATFGDTEITADDLYEYMELTKGGYYKAFGRDNWKLKHVAKIAEFFQIDLSVLVNKDFDIEKLGKTIKDEPDPTKLKEDPKFKEALNELKAALEKVSKLI